MIAPLRAMLTSAVEDELVRENVALRLPRVGRVAKKIEVPTAEQVEAVIRVASPATRGPVSPPPPGFAAARCSLCAGPTSTSTAT